MTWLQAPDPNVLSHKNPPGPFIYISSYQCVESPSVTVRVNLNTVLKFCPSLESMNDETKNIKWEYLFYLFIPSGGFQ